MSYGVITAMADSLDYEISGLQELRDKLTKLSDTTQGKGGSFALRKAANLVRDVAINNARVIDDPKTSPKISENIAVRKSSKRSTAKGDIKFRVGVLGGARDYSAYGEITTGKNASQNPGGDTFYWRFIEFGTQKQPARPFMQPALQQNIGPATDMFIHEWGKAADRAIKRGK